MTRLFALVTDYWLLIALAAVVAVSVARVGFGRKPWVFLPALAILVIGGHFLFANVLIPGMSRWEFAGWCALGVVGVFVLAGLNLVFTGLWSRTLAWVLAGLFTFAVGGVIG